LHLAKFLSDPQNQSTNVNAFHILSLYFLPKIQSTTSYFWLRPICSILTLLYLYSHVYVSRIVALLAY
jgi:hypothetical protein